MLKVKLKLLATCDIKKTSWKKGDICEMINDIFDLKVGVAYYNLDPDWEIIEMKLLEYKEIKK